jgi:hypothetical protein
VCGIGTLVIFFAVAAIKFVNLIILSKYFSKYVQCGDRSTERSLENAGVGVLEIGANNNMEKIFTDEEVFDQIKDKSKNAYIKAWQEFVFFNNMHNFEEGYPSEEAIIAYFKHLRMEKRMATSSIWTHYSYINSIMKRKYNWKLQSLPRITMVIKGFDQDIKHKAAIFEEEVSALLYLFKTF